MKIKITDKKKKELFVSIFQVLKNCSTLITIKFDIDLIHIQGMDKCHVCLFDVKIDKKWFSNYDVVKLTQISIDTNIFHSIITTKSDNQDLNITTDEKNIDILYINFDSITHKGDFKKSFKMPLTEFEYTEMIIPNVEYDAELSLSSKHTSDIFSQLSNFGNDIIIKCSENNVCLNTDGITGEMLVEIPIDDLNSYSILEGEEIILTYSLSYINKMCITNKLSTDIEFSLSRKFPMKISYNLGDDSSLIFFIAPKISE
jgi:proliferating cell nuclear antigen PCNA